MSVGSKTAVSVLNEYLVSKGTTARWELIHNETGTHNPTFVYQVEGLNQCATGEGRSKQEAKQQAASNLLDYLGILEDGNIAEEVNVTVPANTCYNNAVGQLADYCAMKQHPEPEYETVKEEGPPHAKVFLVRCAVSKIHESGQSGKKKVAKQDAALKMLLRLKTQAGEEVNALVPAGDMKTPEKKGPSFNKDEVFDKLSELKLSAPPPAVKYKDHQQAFVGIHENSPTLADIIKNEIENTEDVAVELLSDIVEELKLTKELKEYDTKDKRKPILYLYKISTNPELTGMGYDQNSAAMNLINTLIIMSSEGGEIY